MPTVVHFEIPADDIERSKKFYTDLFGWKIEKWPGTDGGQLTSAATGQPMEYWMITTTDDKGNKALGGGMMKRQMPEHQVTNYIGVKSVDEYSSKVEKFGGKVVTPKHAVPGMGYFALCLDTENNGFAIWESDEDAK
jgi:predicted enzyme related to lactoylglutathione lyase